MILTSGEMQERWEQERWDSDMAQTVASWYMAAGSPALTIFAQTGRIIVGLYEEIVDELKGARYLSDREGEQLLTVFAGWVAFEGIDPA